MFEVELGFFPTKAFPILNYIRYYLILFELIETEKPLTEIKGFLTVGVERFELPTSSL
tara:strand:+ start:271 stop:444 length:174 start_codon:yes stop_codon:yes gene_type:complete